MQLEFQLVAVAYMECMMSNDVRNIVYEVIRQSKRLSFTENYVRTLYGGDSVWEHNCNCKSEESFF